MCRHRNVNTSPQPTGKCVDIATTAALKKMILPGVIAVGAPVIVGFGLGAESLGGLLGGALLGCVLLALMMANAGGAWDNAKKYIEKGNVGGKGSEAHSAAVVGDTGIAGGGCCGICCGYCCRKLVCCCC